MPITKKSFTYHHHGPSPAICLKFNVPFLYYVFVQLFVVLIIGSIIIKFEGIEVHIQIKW